jgi:hypothetical protein
MGAAHFGQADAGITIDFPPGMRRMQTFRKLPMIRPNRKTKNPMKSSGGTSRICHIQRGLSSRAIRIVPDC